LKLKRFNHVNCYYVAKSFNSYDITELFLKLGKRLKRLGLHHGIDRKSRLTLERGEFTHRKYTENDTK
jgi:hypothetical protein